MRKEYVKPESKIVAMPELCQGPGIASGNYTNNDRELARRHHFSFWDYEEEEEEALKVTRKSVWDD